MIGVDDLNNIYIDGSQKRLISRAVGLEPYFTVLDYGCGVGRWTLWFARQVHRVIGGVDISQKMVETARQEADTADIRNVEHHTVRELPLPFENGAFDLVNVVWVLRYLTDEGELAHTVNEICRVVRPGGGMSRSSRRSHGDNRSSRNTRVTSAEPQYSGGGEQYRSLFEECGMVTKESEVSSASPPLYWSYVFVCDTVRRWNLPDLLSKLAPPRSSPQVSRATT